MRSDKAYPYPQIVTGDKWSVLELTDGQEASTDNLNKQMYVPMDRNCENCGHNHSRMIRRTELAHAKWSPKTIGKLMRGTRLDVLKGIENIRVKYLLSSKGKLGIDEHMFCNDELFMNTKRLIENGSVADLVLHGINLVSFEPTDNNYKKVQSSEQYANYMNILNLATDDDSPYHDLRKAEIYFARNLIVNQISSIQNHRWNQIPSYRKVQKMAEKLSAVLNELMDKPKPDEVFKPEPSTNEGEQQENCGNNTASGSECSEDELCQECIDKSESENGELTDLNSLEQRMRQDLIEKMTYTSSHSGIGHWGDMEIHTPPMTVNLQGRLKNSRDYRASDYGYNPKYINRYCVDKKIFKQKQNVKGGTILIDASGSMRFNGEDILEIMKLLPAVNIAMYNGFSNSGDLRVIAKNGMRVDETYLDTHSGGGNVVDGPALQWLATMPARRIWVSDMYVFGAGQHSSAFNLLKECYDLCTKHRIINLKDVDEVKEHALKLNTVL